MKAKVKVDLSGQRFGRLVVIEQADDAITPKGIHVTMWKCKCDCGNETIVRHSQLRTDGTRSCGCLQKESVGAINRTHGLSGNKTGSLYSLWKSIKYRCYTPTCKSYMNYGGRGIVMCDEWKNDFKAFAVWALSHGYSQEKTDKGLNVLTIDRIDVNGNYEPNNCRFITNAEQAKNKRNTMSDEERYAVCPVCGKTYTKSKRNGEKTCSRTCARKLYFINHPNTKDYTKVCPVCGKSFEAKRGGHFKDAVCCSRECANLLRSPIWVFQGEEHRVMEWAEIVGINAHCLLHRKEMGWDIEKILTTPMRKKNYGKSKLQAEICD